MRRVLRGLATDFPRAPLGISIVAGEACAVTLAGEATKKDLRIVDGCAARGLPGALADRNAENLRHIDGVIIGGIPPVIIQTAFTPPIAGVFFGAVGQFIEI